MSKVWGGGSWAGSGCDCEAGREASVVEVLKDSVSAMFGLLYCRCGVEVGVVSDRPARRQSKRASRRSRCKAPEGRRVCNLLSRGYRDTSLTLPQANGCQDLCRAEMMIVSVKYRDSGAGDMTYVTLTRSGRASVSDVFGVWRGSTFLPVNDPATSLIHFHLTSLVNGIHS